MIKKAAELEAAYGRDTMPRGFSAQRALASSTCTSSPTAAAPSSARTGVPETENLFPG